MIKRIRDFFCTADPIGMTVVIMIGGILLAEMIAMGFGMFFGVIIIGLILMGLIFGIGWCLHKAIVFAQSFCK